MWITSISHPPRSCNHSLFTYFYPFCAFHHNFIQEIAGANAALNTDARGSDPNKEWIHVGDDLAYDVGGAASCGAKTILVELADKYGQTARRRFDGEEGQPSWSTNSRLELEKRKIMNNAAESKVDRRIAFLSRLPETIQDILNE